MQAYILKRALLNIPVILGVLVSVFLVVRLIPGDAVTARLGELPLTSEQQQEIREDLGLDKSQLEQFIQYVKGLPTGDMGRSFYTGEPTLDRIAKALPVSLELAFLAILVSLVVAIPLGIISAIRPNTMFDYLSRFFAVVGLSTPDFVLALLALIVMSRWLGYLPPVTGEHTSLLDDPRGAVEQLWVPALILGVRQAAVVQRMTRSALLEVLRADYIRTAWAKGLHERRVVLRHAMKNAMIPVVTIIGTQAGVLLGGTVIMELIFNVPGIGRQTFESVTQRDYTQLQANVLVLATFVVSINLFVDICYTWLDPRIRLR